MLHHVRPRRERGFQPNRHLEITPDFLRAMLGHLRARGIDIVTMDEVHQRLIERKFSAASPASPSTTAIATIATMRCR